jgi:hypothetical protein
MKQRTGILAALLSLVLGASAVVAYRWLNAPPQPTPLDVGAIELKEKGKNGATIFLSVYNGTEKVITVLKVRVQVADPVADRLFSIAGDRLNGVFLPLRSQDALIETGLPLKETSAVEMKVIEAWGITPRK